MKTIKLLIVEDHAVVRKGLRHILADKFRRAEFGEARNAQEALTRIWREKWDVVVLDITMPGRSGLEVLEWLTSSSMPIVKCFFGSPSARLSKTARTMTGVNSLDDSP